MTGILVLVFVWLAACDSDSTRSARTGDALAAAGIPGSVANAAGIDQESAPKTIRRVWGGPEVDLYGSVSYDGRYLSFVDWSTGDLAVRNMATGEVRRLTDKGSWATSGESAEGSIVSPDGEQVAYTWYIPFETNELRLIDIEGSEPRVLYRDESVEYIQPMAWSVDGEKIVAAIDRRGEMSQMMLITVADGSARLLKSFDRGYGGVNISPDGRYVIYDMEVEKGSEFRDIFLIEIDEDRERQLVEHPADDFALGWAPDGQHILFASDRTGTVGGWLLRVKDGEAVGDPVLAKPDMWRMTPLGFTSDGSYYYGVNPTLRNVFVASIDVTTGELLAAPTPVTRSMLGENGYPAWSANGRYLAYQSVREKSAGGAYSRVTCIRFMETGEIREITPKGVKYFAPRIWFRGGGHLLGYGEDEDDRFGLFRLDVQTGEAEAYENFWGVDVAQPIGLSADERSLYYKVWLDDGVGFAVRGLEGGGGELLYRWNSPGEGRGAGFERVALSPDASYLAFNEYDGGRARVLVMPSTGGEPRVLVELPAEGRGPSQIAWTSDGQSVVYELGDELWVVPRDGGEPRKLKLAVEQMRHIRFHPDGRRVAYDAEPGGGAEIWVMENFLPTDAAGTEDSE
jgi:Tol biopolymer transport system component